jgi:hypothetical protein
MRLPEASGKKILFGMLILALIMVGSVFWLGKKERDARRESLKSNPMLATPEASSDNADSVSSWWQDIPHNYVRITPLEGLGLVRYEPCTAPVATLSIVAVPGFFPTFECDFCDSLNRAEAISGSRSLISLDASTSLIQLKVALEKGGRMEYLPVTETLLAKFPRSPLREHLLIWITNENDTLLFTPNEMAEDFEWVKAEDESPEGCAEKAFPEANPSEMP